MSGEKQGQDEGVTDELDFDPEFHELEEDHAMEQMKKDNPKLYALMKKHGAEVDEDDSSADQDPA